LVSWAPTYAIEKAAATAMAKGVLMDRLCPVSSLESSRRLCAREREAYS
jgi:hypothetical protein